MDILKNFTIYYFEMVEKVDFYQNSGVLFFSFKELINLYENIYSTEQKQITYNNYVFNNYIGDTTKNIIWTWVINNKSYDIFNKFFLEINLINQLNKLYHQTFTIYGISFVSLHTNKVLDTDSFFHYDILSPYDDPYETKN